MKITDTQARRVHEALDGFAIELPSWGFADTGTRFGKFHQPAAAATLEDKLLLRAVPTILEPVHGQDFPSRPRHRSDPAEAPLL